MINLHALPISVKYLTNAPRVYIYIYTNETKKKIQMITQTQKTQEITVLHIYETIY